MGIARRNGKIELMRFLMCIFVIIYHAETSLVEDPVPRFLNFITMSKHGCFGVEFFFVLSGFFMAKSAEKAFLSSKNYTLTDTIFFISKKYTSIIPFQFIGFFLVFIIKNLLNKGEFVKVLRNLFDALPDLFLFSMSGVPYYKVNGVDWYLSSMIICMIIIYPFLRKYYDKFSKFFAPVISLLLLLFLFTHNEPTRLSAVYKLYGFLRVANIRATCELLLGVVCYEISKKIGAHEWSRSSLIFMTAVEVLSALSVVIYIFSPLTEAWQYLFLFVSSAFITLALSGVTLGNSHFEKKWIYYLGKLSLSVYIVQYVGMNFAEKYLQSLPFYLFILFSVVTAVIIGMIIMPLCNKLAGYVAELFKKIHLIY